MELSLTLRSQSQCLSFSSPFPRTIPISPKLNKPTSLTVRAKKKPSSIEGVSDELNAIASQNLDFAPSRRRVREAFTEVHQQLDHYLFKNAPAGIRTEEWYERNSRGLEIFCKSWMPEPGVPIKGALCFCHGYGGTCTFFFEGIAKQFAASGYGVYAMDFPGFGLSEGLHGYIPNFDDLVDDVIEQYTKIKARPEVRELPRFIMGQSMGGAIALKVHLKEPSDWDGVILVAPMCKIADEMLPSTTTLKVLNLLSKVTPKAKLFPYKDLNEFIFREPGKRKLAVYNVISYDDKTRLKTGMELLSATQDIESQLQKVSAPLLILHGAEDKVTDPLVSQFLYEKASSKDKTLKIYEEGYHGIMEGEPDDRIFAVHNDIISWLDFSLDSSCVSSVDSGIIITIFIISMSILNQLFSRGVFSTRCKTCLNLSISRIKLLQNKRDVQLKQMRREISQFLQAGQEAIARIRVEHIIREQNIWAAYEILELFCEFVLARVPIIESQKECPSELREAIASIIFAAPRCSDIPDLLHIKNLFTTKYGKEFVTAVSELRPDSGVNRTIIEKLSVSAPSGEVKLKVLKEIAKEYNLAWDSSKTEAEFRKNHEDLLGGTKQVGVGAAPSRTPSKKGSDYSSPSTMEHSIKSNHDKQEHKHLEAPIPSNNNSWLNTNEIEESHKNNGVPVRDAKSETKLPSSDVLEKARAAIASADRATAAARAAAALVHSNFGSLKRDN